jgi:MFS family permease
MAMNYNKIASPQITEEKFLQSVVLVNGVSNGLFRFVWGAFFKQFGFKYVFLIAMSLNIISFSLMEWSYLAKESYMIMHGISGAILGGLMVMVPNLCLLVFGDRIGNKIYSYYWGAFTFSNFLQYLVGVYFGESYGWVGLFKIFLIQSTLGLLFGLSITYQGRWENSL